jgi:hypothetical protein
LCFWKAFSENAFPELPFRQLPERLPKQLTARTNMTKEEIVKAIRVCAKKLRRNPSLRELRAMSGVTTKHVYKKLGSLSKALRAAGLEGIGPGFSPAERDGAARLGKRGAQAQEAAEHCGI